MHDARLLYMYLVSPRTIYKFAEVSSLKSQVSSLSGLPKSQVSSLKYSSLCFVFFHFMTSLTAFTVDRRASERKSHGGTVWGGCECWL